MQMKKMVREFAKSTGRTILESQEILYDIIEFMEDMLIAGESIKVKGYFKIYTDDVDPVNKYNIHTKQVFVTKGRKKIKAKFGNVLLDSINGKRRAIGRDFLDDDDETEDDV